VNALENNKMYNTIKIKQPHQGFTLVELMLAIAIIGILASISITSYNGYVEKAKVTMAVEDISAMVPIINQYYEDNRDYPDSLADVGLGAKLDPWERPYAYLNLNKYGNGGARRDKNLNPLNSDFDLYSLGKDGVTKLPISQKDSLDDVLRANDGRFIDLASKY
jgi:general secretion pathway protein G